MNSSNDELRFIDFDFVELSFGSSFTPTPRGEKNREQLAGELGAAIICNIEC